MIDHSTVWQLKVAIGQRIESGTMTQEHLKAFVAMSREDLDRVFTPSNVTESSVLLEAARGVL